MAPFLIGLLIIGGGASLAAKSAVPGDMLYGVKVGFNENLRSSLSFSDESKAHWDAIRQGRRLDEAAKLSAEGKLDAEVEAKLKERFNAYSEDYDKRMEKMKAHKGEGKAEAAAQVDADARAIFSSRKESMNSLGVSASSGINMNSGAGDADNDLDADGVLNVDLNRSNGAGTDANGRTITGGGIDLGL